MQAAHVCYPFWRRVRAPTGADESEVGHLYSTESTSTSVGRGASMSRGGPRRHGERGRRPRPRDPPERGSVGDRRAGVPRQPLGYTGGMRSTRGPNHGRRSRKFNQDCMIRHSCCSTRSDSDVSGLRVKLNRLAGIRGAPVRSNSTSLVLHWTFPRPSYAATGSRMLGRRGSGLAFSAGLRSRTRKQRENRRCWKRGGF